MTARIYSNPWMLKVWREPGARGGDGWPKGDAIIHIEYGGHGTRVPVLDIVGDDTLDNLIEKLQQARRSKP